MKQKLYILCLFIAGLGYGQTVYIEDNTFRTFLQNNYEQTMVGDSLDTQAAAGVVDTLAMKGLGINSFQGIEYFIAVTGILADSNNINSFPDISTFSDAFIISLNYNRLTSLEVSSQQDNLRTLNISNNMLTQLPNIVPLTNIQSLDARDNLISSFVTSFENNSTLDSLHLENNKLSFEEFLSINSLPMFSLYHLFPQDSIGPGGDFERPKGESIRYYLNQDSSVISSEYKWYLNDVPYITNQSPFLDIDTTGVFTVYIKNENVSTEDSLVGKSFTVSENLCFTLDGLNYQSKSIDCNIGGEVYINENSISGGTSPFTYVLISSFSGDSLSSLSGIFTDLKETTYSLYVKDNAGCTETLENFISIQEKADCDIIITKENPSFFIKDKGDVKIYDRSGKLIKSLKAPVYWNGTDKDGRLVSMGLYFVNVGEQVYKVTMIR